MSDELSGYRQGMTRAKIKPEIEKRIEAIGKLNDRWLEALENNDVATLLKLAYEYEGMNMPRIAKAIRLDVVERQR